MLRRVPIVAPVADYLDSLVHPDARTDALTFARHRAFIAHRLLGGLIALAAVPVVLAVRGFGSGWELIALAWLVAPLAIAYFVARTGRIEVAHVLSATTLAGLVTTVAWPTGGLMSFAAVWLAVVPLEAASSRSPRVVVWSAGVAAACAVLLWFAGPATIVPPIAPPTLLAIGIVSAAAYATGLVLSLANLSKTGDVLHQEGSARYDLLARNTTDVVVRHGPGGVVTFVSPAAERLTGEPSHVLLGTGLFERVHVADRPAWLTTLVAAKKGEGPLALEFRLRRERSGIASWAWVEMRCRAVESGSSGEVVAVIHDISDRKAHEMAIETARSAAEKANAAKSRFLATISHELRTPLNAIIGFSELLTNDELMKANPDRRRDYARLIHESGNHLLSVVNGMLDMSKIESGAFDLVVEPFSVEPVVRHCAELLALRAHEQGLILDTVIRPDLPELHGDKRALKQILLNLLSNAVKFTDRGGRIAMSVDQSGPDIVFVVEDNGIGIGEDDLPRVGDPFFQARSAYNRPFEGTGLGLSVVKGLVDLHGGVIRIDSRLGAGTRVVVSLPIQSRRTSPAEIVTVLTQPKQAGKAERMRRRA